MVAELEYQVAVLVRLITATRPKNPAIAALDRSAYLILHQLAESINPLSLQELAALLKVDLSTMSRQVFKMESKGLVERILDTNDSRVHRIAMTVNGSSQLDIMRTARKATYSQILNEWSDADRSQVAYLVKRLNDSIREYQERDS